MFKELSELVKIININKKKIQEFLIQQIFLEKVKIFV